MKTFAMTLTAAGMVLGTALPVLAQDMDPETLTCAEFMALPQDQQGEAVLKLQEAKRASGTMDTTTSTDTSGAPPPSTADTAASGSSSESGDNAGGTSLGSDPDVAALQTACTGQDAMLAKDLVTVN